MKNIIFIDVDGTLVGQDGQVPESARLAIKKTRELGNEVILATGRSLSEITDDIRSVGLDGIIGANGGYVELNDKVLLHQTMNETSLRNIINYFDEHKVGYYLESNQGLFPNEYCIPNIKQVSKDLLVSNPELFINKDNPEPTWFFEILEENLNSEIPYDDINKVSFISTDLDYEEIASKFNDEFEVYHATVFEFGPKSGEIALGDVNKNTAIDLILSQYDEPVKTFAYGDGENDISMFETVDHCVAMNNARTALKAIATEITDIAENDGIYNSFKKNRLV